MRLAQLAVQQVFKKVVFQSRAAKLMYALSINVSPNQSFAYAATGQVHTSSASKETNSGRSSRKQ